MPYPPVHDFELIELKSHNKSPRQEPPVSKKLSVIPFIVCFLIYLGSRAIAEFTKFPLDFTVTIAIIIYLYFYADSLANKK